MSGAIDWAAVRARLAAAEATLQRVEETEALREDVFAQRAADLAAPPPARAAADTFAALTFALGQERYALRAEQIREVRPLDRLTPLPTAPPFVAGLVNVRGRIVPVLNLQALFNTPEAGGESSSSGVAGQAIVLIAGPLGDVGVLVSGRPAVVWIREGELGPLPPGTPAGLDPTYVLGVAPGFVVVLDGRRLLADPRLGVDEHG